jgi:hypothetical protein
MMVQAGAWVIRGESDGEKRTGPALNPLKGSSARFPHGSEICIPRAIHKPCVISKLNSRSR